MFDCGEGTQHQILETTIKPRKISKIFSSRIFMVIIFLVCLAFIQSFFQANEEQTDIEIYGLWAVLRTLLCPVFEFLVLVYLSNYFHEFDENSLGKHFGDGQVYCLCR